MGHARGTDGERLFRVPECLTLQQVSSYFSHLAEKPCQQQIEVTTQDALAEEEQSNFSLARMNVLSSLDIRHPIVVDQYDICSLVNNKSDFRKMKVRMLQHLCQSSVLEVPVPAVRRKAPYVALLEDLVNGCSCRS